MRYAQLLEFGFAELLIPPLGFAMDFIDTLKDGKHLPSFSISFEEVKGGTFSKVPPFVSPSYYTLRMTTEPRLFSPEIISEGPSPPL